MNINKNDNKEVLLKVNELKKYFPIQGGVTLQVVDNLKAVDGVSFYVNKGETLGIVGESGCGKSTLGRVILRLLDKTSGEVQFKNNDIYQLTYKELRKIRRSMQIIFQDPLAALHPRMTVKGIIGEPLKLHGIAKGPEKDKKIEELVNLVGLDKYHLSKYPHEFSGGQQQRVGIARALSLTPELIVCDEPVSALDVSIQSQIINLLKDLQEEFDMAYIFIAHDLSVVKNISDRVAIMYLGKIVEIAEVEKFFRDSKHPYTEALISAIPMPDPQFKKERIILKGDVPSPVNIPKGCRFNPRCRYRIDICMEQEPDLKVISDNHYVACHLVS